MFDVWQILHALLLALDYLTVPMRLLLLLKVVKVGHRDQITAVRLANFYRLLWLGREILQEINVVRVGKVLHD